MIVIVTAVLCSLHLAAPGEEAPGGVYFQSHRGGLGEKPENTLVAFAHSWAIPGAIPEVDLQTSKDGVIVCMHDGTPRKSTDAPPPWDKMNIKDIPLEEIRKWDAGLKFNRRYAGTKVPTLDEVFDMMAEKPERQLCLDLKAVDLDTLVAAIRARGFEHRVIFVHGDAAMCRKLAGLYPGARTMTWIGGSPEEQKKRFAEFEANGFAGITQLQFHLRPKKMKPEIEYLLDDAYLREAVKKAEAAGTALQLRPFAFNPASLRRLIDLGVRWYVSDHPKAFAKAVKEALAK